MVRHNLLLVVLSPACLTGFLFLCVDHDYPSQDEGMQMKVSQSGGGIFNKISNIFEKISTHILSKLQGVMMGVE